MAHRDLLALMLGFALSVGVFSSGCSAKKRVVTTVTHEVVAHDQTSEDEDDAPRAISETTETSTEEMGPFCSGVLSCTIQSVGWVIALPFRAIVAFVDVLF